MTVPFQATVKFLSVERDRHALDGIGVVFGASLVEQPGVSKL